MMKEDYICLSDNLSDSISLNTWHMSCLNGNVRDYFVWGVEKIEGKPHIFVLPSCKFRLMITSFQHDLLVSAQTKEDHTVTSLRIIVKDVNDNAPEIIDFVDSVTLIEEDDRNLPKILTKVIAVDADSSEENSLLYQLEGDGVDVENPIQGTFVIHPTTGEIVQIKPIDRDAPSGKPEWKLRIKLTDGPRSSKNLPAYISELESMLKNYEVNRPFTTNNSIGFSRKKLVERHRRETRLFNRKLNLTSTPNTNLRYGHRSSPSVIKHQEIDSVNKRQKIQIRIFTGNSRINSNQKTGRGLQWGRGKGNKSLDIIDPYHRRVRNLSQLKARAIKLPSYKIRATLGVRIYKKSRKGIENLISNYYKNISEIGMGDPLFKRNSSLVTLNRISNWKIFDLPLYHTDFNNVKNIPKKKMGTKKIKIYKIFHEASSKTREIVDLNNKHLDVKRFSRYERAHIDRLAIKQRDCENSLPTDNKRISCSDSRMHYIKEKKIKESFLSQFSYKRSQCLTLSKDMAVELNSKELHGLNNKTILKNKKNIHISCKKLYRVFNQSFPFIKKIFWKDFRGGKISKRSLLSNKETVCPQVTFPFHSPKVNEIHILEREFTVFVRDINDNTPRFTQKLFKMKIAENGKSDALVGSVSAVDNDDVSFGTNALLTYSLEKNVVEEHTGERLFKINSTSGEIRTALCCLDREVTSFYRLQVVATDGGGLQGTATVLVNLEDQNDNAPKFVKKEWKTEVKEHFGHKLPKNNTALEATVVDLDSSNDFSYRIIQSSGPGWQLFGIEEQGSFCRIYATSNLDYENNLHKGGFRFKIQVSDQGSRRWADPRHTDTAWIQITLVDVNDNSPSFNNSNANVFLRENVEPGAYVTTLAAYDLDSGENSEITYSIDDPFNSFRIDSAGEIWVTNELDREGPVGPQASVRVRAIDRGNPRLAGTATLTVTLLDVNDCAPYLSSSQIYHVRENDPPSKIGVLIAGDRDNDTLNHGAPFEFKLYSSFPREFASQIRLNFVPELNGGKGVGELWTTTLLDRENQSEIILNINVSDVSGLSANHTIKIIIDDVNDNQMLPGQKVIYILKPKALVWNYRVGRVFINDADDWDVSDKTFRWFVNPHQHFRLNEKSGNIYVEDNLPDGRYELQFKVSDHVWKQFNVEANVSIVIKNTEKEMFLHAVPVSFSSISSTMLAKGWIPKKGGGILGRFIEAAQSSLKNFVENIEVLSVEENPSTVFDSGGRLLSPYSSCQSLNNNDQASSALNSPENLFKVSSKIWIAASHHTGYLNSLTLKGLLELKMDKITEKTSLVFSLEEQMETTSKQPCFSTFSQFSFLSVSTLYEKTLTPNNFQMQVVDMNTTSIVTPLLSTPNLPCPLQTPLKNSFPNLSLASFSPEVNILSSLLVTSSDQNPTFCTKYYCLNGGRCIPTETASRCICPGGTIGPRCKVVSRTFFEGGWAWLPRLPSTLPLRISLHFLSLRDDGLIFYQGPFSSIYPFKEGKIRPILSVYLNSGRPILRFENYGIELVLKVHTSHSLADEKWHSLHILITHEKVNFMVDFCAGEEKSDKNRASWDLKTCYASADLPDVWRRKERNKIRWESQAPLQVAGVAHLSKNIQSESRKRHFKAWRKSFVGCLSHLRINKMLIDLGEPAYNYNSVSNCQSEDQTRCETSFFPLFHDSSRNEDCHFPVFCRERKNKVVSEEISNCECDMTPSSSFCGLYKRPVTLGVNSYSSIALSFLPSSQNVSIKLKFRTKSTDGLLVMLASRKSPLKLSIEISDGYLCLNYSTSSKSRAKPSEMKSYVRDFSTSNSSETVQTGLHFPKDDTFHDIAHHSVALCLTKKQVIDGAWHRVYASRLGHNLFLQLDGGDDWKYNETLLTFERPTRPLDFLIDVREGVSIGGIPKHIRKNVSFVSQDLSATCLDDLQISGQQLPLPPFVNNTDAGQVTTMHGMKKGCHFNPTVNCSKINCPPQFECQNVQEQPVCGCRMGSVFTPSGCQKIDICLFSPCLNGGSCKRTDTGFSCLCPSELTGKYCEWNPQFATNHGLSTFVALAIAASIVVFLVSLMICFICWRRRRKVMKRKDVKREPETTKEENNTADSVGPSIMPIKRATELSGIYPPDDLRNYAYEGGDSLAESLGSSIFASLHNEIGDPLATMRIDPNLCEVVDLVKELPDTQLPANHRGPQTNIGINQLLAQNDNSTNPYTYKPQCAGDEISMVINNPTATADKKYVAGPNMTNKISQVRIERL